MVYFIRNDVAGCETQYGIQTSQRPVFILDPRYERELRMTESRIGIATDITVHVDEDLKPKRFCGEGRYVDVSSE